ncbi:MAG: helix-turn-helix domain-containing protein [Geminicoccaceae bacterium]
MTTSPTFPSRLTWWRKHRGLSQLQLALGAGCSQRHVSFLELGRTRPSREMVMRLAEAMTLPLRQSNELLLTAGFAPIWHESRLDDEALAPVRLALDRILDQQEPFPAMVVDRRWNLLQANRGAAALVEFLAGPIEPGSSVNLADALTAPDGLRSFLANWPEVVCYFLRSVEADAAADGTAETAAMLQRLKGYPGVQELISAGTPLAAEGPVLPMHFQKDGIELRLFTTIATLGTPQDITLQELRIESFFPLDKATREVFRGWAAAV